MSELSHLDAQGRARMVDVSAKPVVRRMARAEGMLRATAATIDRAMGGDVPKGDAIGTARIAAILAAKQVDRVIPLCHTLPLDEVAVSFERAAPDMLRVTASARVSARTGVEMEALTAVTVALLTLYDMLKAIDKSMSLEGIRVVEKVKEAT